MKLISIIPCTKKRYIPNEGRLIWKRPNFKFLEENKGEAFLDTGLGSDFLAMTLKEQTMKSKIDKWDYNKQKSFCTAKQTIDKTKRQTWGWEKIFVNHIWQRVDNSKYIGNYYNSIAKSK